MSTTKPSQAKEDFAAFLERAAKDALRRPECFLYFGDKPLFDSWGLVGGHCRDSSEKEHKRYRALVKRMTDICFNEVEEIRSTHWSVGWIEQVAVKVRYDNGTYTNVFKCAARAAFRRQKG